MICLSKSKLQPKSEANPTFFTDQPLASPLEQTSSSYSTKSNYQSACNIDLKSAQNGSFSPDIPICPLISKLSSLDGSVGNLNNLIHSSSGNGACPAACLVKFSAFYSKSVLSTGGRGEREVRVWIAKLLF
jgi:hypothetical protein